MAADGGLEILRLDVKAAFLNGKLDETIFMNQPEGYVNANKRDHIYRLFKALYGLKKVSRT